MKYSYVIVGAGLSGAIMARELTNAGKSCLIIEKSNHIAGACYDKKVENYYQISTSGHIFHTSNDVIWQWANKYGEWIPYTHKVKSRIGNTIYSFPINLSTLHQLWGCITPNDAIAALKERSIHFDIPNANMETWCLNTIGEELYELFIKGYTFKQWNKYPSELPASIVRRLPLRMTYDDRYYTDTYQVMPKYGYTEWIKNIIGNIPLVLEYEYGPYIHANHVIYTGSIDEYYNYKYGKLEYRSCKFKTDEYDHDYQGAATINYPSIAVPYTRKIEWQHFYSGKNKTSKVMTEYPSTDGIPYYPIQDEENTYKYYQYKALQDKNVTFVGRLGTYRYLDMDAIIGQVLKVSKDLLS